MTVIDDQESWCGIADLLQEGVPAAKLAAAIETAGVWVYDDFGRLVEAGEGDEGFSLSKSAILKLLAKFNKSQNEILSLREQYESEMLLDAEHEFDDWFSNDSPLWLCGWKKSQCPNFEEIDDACSASDLKRKAILMASPPKSRRESYLLVIDLICEHAGTKRTEKGLAKALEVKANARGLKISEDTILSILNEVDDAIEERSK